MQRPQASVSTGTVLIRKGSEIPSGVFFDTVPYSHDWELIAESRNIDARLCASGWNLFFIANTLRVTSLDFGDTSLRKGVNRLLKQVRELHLNSLRVTHIVSKTFLGIPYIVLIAHPCHLQRSCFLHALDRRKESIIRLDLQLAPAHTLAVPSVKATETT